MTKSGMLARVQTSPFFKFHSTQKKLCEQFKSKYGHTCLQFHSTALKMHDSNEIFQAWLRGTWYAKRHQFKIESYLQAGFAVRGDINSRWKAILDAGYAVYGRRKFKMESCLRGTRYALKGHSQLVHMRIRYHFLADLHITLHHKIRVAIMGSTGRRDSHVRVLA